MAKYAYEQLLTEHKLTVNDLSDDAKIAIESIKSIERAINMAEKKAVKNGKEYKASSSINNKIKAFDKWIVREILDEIEDKDTNVEAPPVIAEEIIEEIKVEGPKIEETKNDPKGINIDLELAELLKNNKQELTLDDLKLFAPISYSTIFEAYERGGQNGISTGNFELLEKNDKFILTKK